MPTRLARRAAAPLLVIAGAALFGLGAGGIARVDGELDAAAQPARTAPPQALDAHRRVRFDRRWARRGEL